MSERKRVNGQPEIVYVEWIDSTRTEGWSTAKEIQEACKPMKCRTVGFVARENDTEIVLALSAAHGEHVGSPYCSLMTIPKLAITLRAPAEAYYAKAKK